MNKYNNYSYINISIVILMVLYWGFRWLNNYNEETHFLITGIVLLISVGWIIIMQIFRLALNLQPLIVPTLFLLTLTFPDMLHNNYSSYFIDVVCATALSAFYQKSGHLLIFLIVSQLFTVFLYLNGYLVDNYAVAERWAASFITSIVIYILTKSVVTNKETAFRHAETFSSILKATNDHIVILDNLRRVKYMSRLLIKIFGFDNFPYIVENRPFVDLFRKPELKQVFNKILAENDYEIDNIELRDVLEDKPNYFINVKLRKLPNNSGFLLQATDVTDSLIAKNEAEKANKTKSDFLASMSHELRTPLNAINGLAELELRKNLPHETQINLEKILNSGEVLLNTINDILDISKIEAGRFDLHPDEYSFTSFMCDTLNMNVVRIGSKPIKIQVEVDENIPDKLIGDEMRIRQIFNNLLSNAIKYTFDGTVTLKIGGIIKGNSIWLSVSVKDTGIGISQEDITKLFHSYSVVDADSHKGIEGTGLGLSITKQLVSLMDGDISVESDYGKGSTFYVRFRQKISDFTPISAENAKNIQNFTFYSKYKNKNKPINLIQIPNTKALVVDDVQVNLDVAVGMLSAYGMQIDTAISGKEAIAKIRERKVIYDIVFMDHMMPDLDGIETVNIIRNEIDSDYAKNISIVALTANALVGMSKIFLENGFQDYLSKPINAQKLDDVIHKFLTDKKENSVLLENDNGRRSGSDRRISERRHSAPQLSEKEIYQKLLNENPIPGINFDEAIKQFNSMVKIYIRVLGSFVKNTPAILEKLANPTTETLDDYKISVHGLKGSFYGIGANELGKLAENLEKEADAQNLEAILEKNGEFSEKTQELLVAVASLVIKSDEIFVEQNKTDEPNRELLKSLLESAKSYDIEKISQNMAELEKFTYENGGDLIKSLREAADAFDYDKLIELLS